MKYRKRPIVIDAFHWIGQPDRHWPEWLGCDDRVTYDGIVFEIQTLEGTMNVSLGDWIIRGVKGELYPCKQDIFEATYEPVAD